MSASDAAPAGIRAVLATHRPADAKEARDLRLMRQLVDQEPDILRAHCPAGHITASALIVDPASRRALLHYHKRLNRWLQVGGHLEGDADVACAALREAREETGLPDLAFHPPNRPIAPIDIDIHWIPATCRMPAHPHLDCRYLLATGMPASLAPRLGESTRFRWLSLQEAQAMCDGLDEALLRLLGKAFAILDKEI